MSRFKLRNAIGLCLFFLAVSLPSLAVKPSPEVNLAAWEKDRRDASLASRAEIPKTPARWFESCRAPSELKKCELEAHEIQEQLKSELAKLDNALEAYRSMTTRDQEASLRTDVNRTIARLHELQNQLSHLFPQEVDPLVKNENSYFWVRDFGGGKDSLLLSLAAILSQLDGLERSQQWVRGQMARQGDELSLEIAERTFDISLLLIDNIRSEMNENTFMQAGDNHPLRNKFAFLRYSGDNAHRHYQVHAYKGVQLGFRLDADPPFWVKKLVDRFLVQHKLPARFFKSCQLKDNACERYEKNHKQCEAVRVQNKSICVWTSAVSDGAPSSCRIRPGSDPCMSYAFEDACTSEPNCEWR
jgi:hypothetical protein